MRVIRINTLSSVLTDKNRIKALRHLHEAKASCFCPPPYGRVVKVTTEIKRRRNRRLAIEKNMHCNKIKMDTLHIRPSQVENTLFTIPRTGRQTYVQ